MLYINNRFIVIAILTAFVIHFVIPLSALSETKFPISIGYFEGDVQIQRNGIEIEPARGKQLEVSDVIVTGADGKIDIELDNGTIMRIKANSKVQLLEYVKDGKGKKTTVENFFGGIIFNVKKFTEKRESFEVKTPTATAAVRGTIFACEVTEDQTSIISVLEGVVGVNSVENPQKSEVKVKKHQKATISKGGKILIGVMTAVEIGALSSWSIGMLQGAAGTTGAVGTTAAATGGIAGISTTALVVGGTVVATAAVVTTVIIVSGGSEQESEKPKSNTIPSPPGLPK